MQLPSVSGLEGMGSQKESPRFTRIYAMQCYHSSSTGRYNIYIYIERRPFTIYIFIAIM